MVAVPTAVVIVVVVNVLMPMVICHPFDDRRQGAAAAAAIVVTAIVIAIVTRAVAKTTICRRHVAVPQTPVIYRLLGAVERTAAATAAATAAVTVAVAIAVPIAVPKPAAIRMQTYRLRARESDCDLLRHHRWSGSGIEIYPHVGVVPLRLATGRRAASATTAPQNVANCHQKIRRREGLIRRTKRAPAVGANGVFDVLQISLLKRWLRIRRRRMSCALWTTRAQAA
jgi:hypothetical protein